MKGSCHVRVVQSVIHVFGSLRAPLRAELRHQVQALLGCGKRRIDLNLAGVSDLDAAGLGELVCVYNMASAVDAVVRITHPSERAREFLQRAGLLEVLSYDSPRLMV